MDRKEMLEKDQFNSDGCIDSGLGSLSCEDYVVQLKELDLDAENGRVESWFAQDENGDSYLHLAVFEKEENLACKMIDFASSAALIDSKNHLGQTPLLLAVKYRLYHVVRSLIDHGVDLEVLHCETLSTILHVAAENQDVKMLCVIYTETDCFTDATRKSLTLLKDAKNSSGLTPLHVAVQNGDLEFIKWLMLFNADVDVRDNSCGYAAVHHAVLTGNAEIVIAFIDICKPCIDTVSYSGYTAYSLAVANRFNEAQRILVQAGASTNLDMLDD